MKRKRVVMVGSGNVAEALVCALSSTADYRIVQVYARNPERGGDLARMAGCDWTDTPGKLAVADIYLLAVSDKAISLLSETLDFGNGLVAHTSGSCDLGELSPAISRRGVFYPLQTFTAGRRVDFRKIPVFIEAENGEDLTELGVMASALTDRVYRSDSLLRRKLHVGAVFVSNFVNHLYVAGEQWMAANGLEFSVLKPLIEETTRKMLESGSPSHVQTGPAVREDFPTIAKHLALLEEYPGLKNIYELLTEQIIQTKLSDGKL